MPVVALSQDRTMLVRYIGKGRSYSIGDKKPDGTPGRNYKFIPIRLGGIPVEVPLKVWNHLRKQRNADGLREFELAGGGDKEVIAQDRKHSVIGQFVTKRGAMEYVIDTYNVQLIATLSLEQMNNMSLIIKERAAAGHKGDDLIDGLKGAILLEGGDGEDDAGEDISQTFKKPYEAPDDDDEIKARLAEEAEVVEEVDDDGGIDTARRPLPSVSVRKPARVSQMK